MAGLFSKLSQISVEREEDKTKIARLQAKVVALEGENAVLRETKVDAEPTRPLDFRIDVAPNLIRDEQFLMYYNERKYSGTKWDGKYIVSTDGTKYTHPAQWSKIIHADLKSKGIKVPKKHKNALKDFYVMRNGIATKLTDLIE